MCLSWCIPDEDLRSGLRRHQRNSSDQMGSVKAV